MKIIKFRAWDKTTKTFIYFELFNGSGKVTPPIYSGDDLLPWEQYIALDRSKPRKEIYEGDIVEYSQNMSQIKMKFKEVIDDPQRYLSFIDSDESKTWKVVGNIHENKSLIKECL